MMAEAMTLWWVWLSLSLILAILEILLPGYILLGFAIGAALTGLCIVLPGFALSMPVTALIFALLSLAAWFGLRKVFAGTAGRSSLIMT